MSAVAWVRERVRPRPRLALVGAIATVAGVVVVAAIAMVWSSAEPAGPAGRASPSAIELAGPATIAAGESWPITVDGSAEQVVDVLVVSPWGVRRLTPDAVDHGDPIVVPGALTRRSGLLTAVVSVGDASATIDVDVRPGPAVDGVVPLAGPRSIVADAADWTMVTAMPRDRYGNALPDGSRIDVVARRPDGTLDVVETEMEGLLSAVRVTSGTLAGRTTLRIAAGGVSGPEVEVLEVPGPPTDVVLVGPDAPLRADGRSLGIVRTERLVDRHGNELLDGTVAVAHVSGPAGLATSRAVTVDGRVELVLEAPPVPGRLEIELAVDGVRSAPLVVDVTADVGDLPVVVDRVGPSEVRLRIGPVLTGLGGFVADGSDVVVRGPDPASGVLRDGIAVIDVDAAPGEVLEVTVLGASVEVEAP